MQLSKKYEFRVNGYLTENWSDWFAGLEVIHEPDQTTRLVGILPDQSALHGVLAKIRDLRLNLISVNQIEEE